MELRSPTPLRIAIVVAILGVGAVAAAVLTTRGIVPLVLPHRTAIPRPRVQLVDPSSQLPPLSIDSGGPDAMLGVTDAVDQADGGLDQEAQPATNPRRRSAISGKTRDIVRIGPGRYAVRRDALENALAKGGTKGARAVPVAENGHIVGYRLSGVTGQMRELGLRNGDVVTAFNGRKLNSPDAAIAAYGGIRNAKRATIKLKRGGRSVSLGYQIVD